MSRQYSMPGTADGLHIDRKAVAEFFEKRAERIAMIGPLHAVIYQDKHGDLAQRRDAAEKEKLLPLLRLDDSRRVLDIGCGTGRWTDSLARNSAWYHGMDACEGLVAYAREHHAAPNRRFTTGSIESFSLGSLGESLPFDRVLCAGVLIYLNDAEVESALRCIGGVLAPMGLVLFREPMGMDQRLTISQHYSDELEQDYSAVYRTREELEAMIRSVLPETEFRLTGAGEVYDDPTLNNRSDTRQRWMLLERVA